MALKVGQRHGLGVATTFRCVYAHVLDRAGNQRAQQNGWNSIADNSDPMPDVLQARLELRAIVMECQELRDKITTTEK
jgi:hypothetical protein